MHLIKETRWIKLWHTSAGPYLDSKLRWTIHPDADAFISEWSAADAATREEMQAAFVFYPYEFAVDIERILGFIGRTDSGLAASMRGSLFTASHYPTDAQSVFMQELAGHLAKNPPAPALLLETKFYRVHLGELGLLIDRCFESEWEAPTAEELMALVETIPAGHFIARRAAVMVAENPWLLKPAPGESSLPGSDELFGH